MQDSSEASIDIITERDTTTYSDVRSASPRKPLPAQWFPSSESLTPMVKQQRRAHDARKASPSGSPRATGSMRHSVDLGRTCANSTSFLTKEALDAVDANITSPTLRRSPSRIQPSPPKAPWNSPTLSPKIGGLRHTSTSPTKPSPPRTTHLGAHTTTDHRRAPSSIVSTGATSFHSAHCSPVRSSSSSQNSFSSTDTLNDAIYHHCSDFMADHDVEQVDASFSKRNLTSTAATKALLRPRTSRPDLTIRIPPPDTAFGSERTSASALVSAARGKALSIVEETSPGLKQLENHVNLVTQSRIPRIPIGKASSARAPTLSSTLKQTKSTQTLRAPKTIKNSSEPRVSTSSKATGTKSLRHVRTVDDTGSTPISSIPTTCEFSIPGSLASGAMMDTPRNTLLHEVDMLASYLRNTAELDETLLAPSTPSRATSSSTIKAAQVPESLAISSSVGTQTHKSTELLGMSA